MLASLAKYTGMLLGRESDLGQDRGDHVEREADEYTAATGTPLRDAQYVVFDTELTGLKPKKDSIVSIGAVRMQGGMIMLGESFYRVVVPRTELTAQSVVIHEIMPSETAGSPAIDQLLPEFLAFCDSAVLVGHVVSIDLQFLNWEMKRLYGASLQNRAIDTYKLYSWLREKEENYCAYHGGVPESADLFSLAKRFHIPVHRAHNALGDAFTTAQLFQRLISLAPRWGIATLDDLLRVSGP